MTDARYVGAEVSIYEGPNQDSAHIDLSTATEVRIRMAENYGETGSCKIINDLYDPERNLLSPECSRWSDEQKRPIDQNMYIRIREVRTTEDGTERTDRGVYKITTIDVSGDTIRLEFVDSLQMLRCMGADYVYNHYEGDSAWHPHTLQWDGSRAYTDKPSDKIIKGGNTHDIRMMTARKSSMGEKGAYLIHNNVMCYIPRSAYGGDYIAKLDNIYLYSDIPWVHSSWYDIKIGHTEGSDDIHHDHWDGGKNFDRSYTFDVASNPQKYYAPNGFYIKIDSGHGPVASIQMRASDVAGAWVKYWNPVSGRQHDNNRCVRINITALDLTGDNDLIEVSQDEGDRAKLWIDKLNGNPVGWGTIEGCTWWAGTTQLYYEEASRPTPAMDVLDRIVQAAGMRTDIMVSGSEVNYFRCNGDLYHNYLLVLADMPNSAGRQAVMWADTTEWGLIAVRWRYTVEGRSPDKAVLDIYYGKDIPEGEDVTVKGFISFDPQVSLRGRPGTVTAKGRTGSGQAIMVTLTDPLTPVGASGIAVDANAASTKDAVMALYSQIMSGRASRWSGTMVLPLIRAEVFNKDKSFLNFLGGGVPVAITDSRYGFDGKLVRVREAEWDYHNQTTKLTLNNLSETYSNGIVDTSKMAYSGGGMAAEATNSDTYRRQYVSVDAGQWAPSGSIKVYINDGGEAGADTVRVDMPELGIGVINTYFAPMKATVKDRHGVYKIRVKAGKESREIQIPQWRRPDKDRNESLIVNIIYHIPSGYDHDTG